MSHAPEFRIGVNGLPSSVVDLRREVRRYEDLGFDFVAEGDHLAGASPFGVLSAAALVSERLRLRTYVLNACSWNPALLAREVATLDRLSDGRFELGVGAGTDKSEFDDAGIRWRPAHDRVAGMAHTIQQTRRCLSAASDTARPVQEPLPVLVGAMSRAGLAVAAEHADIVAFSGLRHKRGHPPGTLTAVTAEEADDLVTAVSKQTNGRTFESDVLLQTVELGQDPLAGAKAYVEREGEDEDPVALAESPCVLFARTAADAASEVERRRVRWGFTSMTTFAPSADALSAVLREIR